jgi:hypothetical protein
MCRLSGNLGDSSSCPGLYREGFTFTNYAVHDEATMIKCVKPQYEYRDVEVLTEASFRSNDSHTGGQGVKVPNDRCFLLRYIVVLAEVSSVDRSLFFRDVDRYASFLITERCIQRVLCC